MTRDLGRLGEAYFQKLCSEVGLKANKSNENDSTGWDFVVEMPEDPLIHSSSSLEKDFSKSICKIQIKSSDNRPGKHRIKLSNLKRFTHEVTPSFFVFFEFNNKNDPEKMYLVHVGEEIIGKTVKCLREKDIQKDRNIHRKSIPIDYKPTHELNPISGLNLKNLLQKNIGPSAHNYVQKKIDLIKTVGFEGRPFRISFKTKGEEQIESMVNGLLGIKTPTQVENLKISEFRFGLEKEISKQTESTLHFHPSLSPTQVSLICLDESDGEVSRIETSLYSPGMALPTIPDKFKKIRFKSLCIEMIINIYTSEADLKFNIPNNKDEIDLFEYYEQIRFFLKIIETKRIGIERANELICPISFTINHTSLVDDLKEIYTLLEHTCEILKANNIHKCICPPKFLEYQKLNIFLFYHSLKPINDTSLSSTIFEKADFKDLSKVAIVFKFLINLNEWFLGTSIAFAGNVTVETVNERDTVHIRDSKAILRYGIKKKTKLTNDSLKTLENKIKTELEAKDYDLILQKN